MFEGEGGRVGSGENTRGDWGNGNGRDYDLEAGVMAGVVQSDEENDRIINVDNIQRDAMVLENRDYSENHDIDKAAINLENIHNDERKINLEINERTTHL